MTYADKIRKLRKELGLTQLKLGKLVGVSQVSVSFWESEFQCPNAARLEKLNKLAKKHGIKINFGE